MILQALSSGFKLSNLCFIWLNKYLMELREYTDETLLYRGNYWCACKGGIELRNDFRGQFCHLVFIYASEIKNTKVYFSFSKTFYNSSVNMPMVMKMCQLL